MYDGATEYRCRGELGIQMHGIVVTYEIGEARDILSGECVRARGAFALGGKRIAARSG